MFVKHKRYYLLLLPVLGLFMGAKAFGFPWNFDMWLQPSILPYEEPIAYPELSVSREGLMLKPLPREDFEAIAESPVFPTEASLVNGQKLYNRHCYTCHGEKGMGDGPVIKRGFYPLNLTSPGVVGRTDGYIYAYIRYGGKVMMPSYRESLSSTMAWDIVNYVRRLQEDQQKGINTAEGNAE